MNAWGLGARRSRSVHHDYVVVRGPAGRRVMLAVRGVMTCVFGMRANHAIDRGQSDACQQHERGEALHEFFDGSDSSQARV